MTLDFDAVPITPTQKRALADLLTCIARTAMVDCGRWKRQPDELDLHRRAMSTCRLSCGTLSCLPIRRRSFSFRIISLARRAARFAGPAGTCQINGLEAEHWIASSERDAEGQALDRSTPARSEAGERWIADGQARGGWR
jgi:hypothetical protein